MTNAELKSKLKQTFSKMSHEDFAKFSMRFFDTNGGTELLKANMEVAVCASEAANLKVMDDLSKGKVDLKQLPVYTALIGLAAGMSIGVYLMAESLGITEEILEGAISDAEVAVKLEKGIEEIKKKYDRQDDFSRLKIDPTIN